MGLGSFQGRDGGWGRLGEGRIKGRRPARGVPQGPGESQTSRNPKACYKQVEEVSISHKSHHPALS